MNSSSPPSRVGPDGNGGSPGANAPPAVGRSVRRLENARRVRGEGTYVDDVHVPGMLHATVVRSPVAHARIRSIDTAAARSAPGVEAVLGASELGDALRPIPVRLVPDERLLRYLQLPIATARVRYVGEPVALVVARSRAAAEDAADRVDLDLDPLPATTDAAAPPPAPLFDHTPDNLASLIEEGFGDIDAAFARAERVVRLTFRTGRHTAVPMETRGLVAVPDRGAVRGAGRLTIWGPTKVTHFNRGVLAAMLGWPEHRIRLVEPDVGGGFGARGEFYPEDFLVPSAALRLDRPVKWIEDRVEHLSAINHSREQRYELALALGPDGQFLGFRADDDQRHGRLPPHPRDGGAGPQRGDAPRAVRDGGLPVPGALRAHQQDPDRHLPRPRPLRVQRGARAAHRPRRPVERNRTGRDSDAESHSRLRADALSRAAPAFSGRRWSYDTGDYPAALAEAAALSGFLASAPSASGGPAGGDAIAGGAGGGGASVSSPADGTGASVEPTLRDAIGTDAGPAGAPGRLRRGMGLACFVEKTGTGPFEGARAFLDRSGALVIATGACDVGQGLETCLAQIAGDALGVDHAGVTVRHGDTDLIPHGVGSFASRGTVMAGNAVHAAVGELRSRVLERAAARLEVDAGTSSSRRAGWYGERTAGAARFADLATEPDLEAVHYFRCDQMAYSHGVAVARVRVDTATGLVVPERIWVLYDVGRVVNPAIVAGQIEGGVAQGLGGALLEELRYDDTGQFLTGSFMDYLLPGTTDVPSIVHRDLGGAPSPRNPLGVKGAGEIGIAGIGGAIANAVADALGDAERDADRLPLTPERVFERARTARAPEVPAGAGRAVPA